MLCGRSYLGIQEFQKCVLASASRRYVWRNAPADRSLHTRRRENLKTQHIIYRLLQNFYEICQLL
jgi:hypothetical protein